jgi:hypothetical protein
MSDQLSKLPVELINKILDDVSTFDILTCVCLVNKRLRTVSLAYPRFRLDLNRSFKKKRQFDKLCTQLVYLSSQIVSLTLSNENDATIPAKIAYLFSRSIAVNSTFSSLHSLNLSHVDRCIWDSIKVRLTSFIALTSISISFITDKKASTPLFASIILMELLFFTPSLKRLSLNTFFNYLPVMATIDPSRTLKASSIEYLSLDNIGIDLKSLFAVTPALVSLISTVDYSQLIKNIDQQPSANLRRLSITFDHVTLDKIERLLSSMIHLTDFTLVGDKVQQDMANGDRWAQLLNTITTFKFKFSFCKNAFIQKPLDLYSFHTSFWLVEKKWYVTHDWCIDTSCSLLYSNPYCLEWYPFNDMIGTFVTESTGPELTSFPHVEHLDVSQYLLVNNTLLRRCTHVYSLRLSATNLDNIRTWHYATTYLDLTKITYLAIDTMDIGTSSELTVQLVYGLPSLRSLWVSVTILRLLLVHNWPHIVYLAIIWGSDPAPRLLTQNQVDSLCRSFTRVDHLEFSRCFIDNISQILNSMMMTLSYVSIDHSYSMTLHDDRFISYEWLERNTKLRNFGYSCENNRTVHIWL